MGLLDAIIAPFYLALILFVAYKYKLKHQHENEAYKFFIPGLLAKMFGCVCLGLVYFYYYKGGDTINYFNTSRALADLLFSNSDDFMYVYFGSPNASEYYIMNYQTVYVYWVNDPYAFFVAKCLLPFVLLGSKLYLPSAMILAALCYYGIWKMYLVFIEEFPKLSTQLAISILFVPSVVFWGSGLMKDSITLSATCYFVHGFYRLLIKKRFRVKYFAAIFISSFLLVSIKPYILFALFPGSVFWLVAINVTKVKNGLLRFMIAPAIIAVGCLIIYFLMIRFGDMLGKYSFEKVFETAQGAQKDLQKSYYNGNSFDIGDYDATPVGLLSVAHKAIFATLFRPSVLDVRNIVMFISALENTFLLFFCIYLIVKTRVFKFFGLIRQHPLITFSIVFSLFFALSLGVSISNFGTLVRLKIPCIPFFASSLVMINELSRYRRNASVSPSIDDATSETLADTRS
jgi:hypothetical protein